MWRIHPYRLVDGSGLLGGGQVEYGQKRLPATLELTVASLLLAVLLGVPMGVLCAIHRDTIIDHFGRVFSVAGVAMPSFWTGLSRKPLVKRWRDSVEIFEKPLAVGLDEIPDIRCWLGARLKDCKRIDPTFPGIDSNAVASDLDEARDVAVDEPIQLRKGLAQAHPSLRVRRAVPKQPDETAAGYPFALRKAQVSQQPARLLATRQHIHAAMSNGPHRAH